MTTPRRRKGDLAPNPRLWAALREVFRRQIVKDRPIARRVQGVDLPLDGYSSAVLSSGGLCDVCEAEIPVGDSATYHVRTGKTYCARCSPNA